MKEVSWLLRRAEEEKRKKEKDQSFIKDKIYWSDKMTLPLALLVSVHHEEKAC